MPHTMNHTSEIITKAVTLRRRSDNIVDYIQRPGIAIDMAAAREVMDAVKEFGGEGKVSLLIDISTMERPTTNRETRQYLSSSAHARYLSGMALIVGSPVSRVLGNLFINFNKPGYPTRLFSDE